MNENIQVVYVQPPADSEPLDTDISFKVVHTPFDMDAVPLKVNEVLVKNLYVSVDPYHRFGLYDPALTHSHFPATKCGTIISTYGISEVVRSNNVDFAPGEILYAWVRWEKFTVVDQSNLQYLQKVENKIDTVYYLGPLVGPWLTGYPGRTQYA